MNRQIDVIIIGGGLAGLTSAIHLSRAGKHVILIEKNTYPHHKVCGEYLSKEVIPYLNWLDANPEVLGPIDISKLQVTTTDGLSCMVDLPLGGLGISRYALDDFLYRKAKAQGCTVIQDTVTQVAFSEDNFRVSTSSHSYTSKLVLGAYGKRSALDHKLSRSFIRSKSAWLAVKVHYRGNFPADLVALHNFKGGYCGVSRVENDTINICYLVDYETFKSHTTLLTFQQEVLNKNKFLKKILDGSTSTFNTPLTISQISFKKKEKVKNHILMIGDTAGLIHPLCGNGMGMAIHSAKICSTLVLDYLDGRILSREKLEKSYLHQWRTNFSKRIRTGRFLSGILRHERCAAVIMRVLVKFPQLLAPIIRMTHGRPLITEKIW
ncbi:MAG: FAD-dependent oxidoreductase [Pedobacter sp.]|nr:FAD-dependent oxidoreductase [Pedobacter sp.]